MKQTLLTLIFTVIALTFCYSQDIITTKSGENIQAKVVEVGQTLIKYKKVDNPDGPTYTIDKADVVMTRYENGVVEVYKVEKKKAEPTPTVPGTENLFFKGQADAIKYYKKYSGSGTGTLFASLLSPLFGLFPAIACSVTMPKDKNLGYPDPALMKNADYYLGYTQRAHKIKQGKVWLNWGIGLGVNVAAELVILATSH